MNTAPRNINEYLAALPGDQKKALQRLRQTIRPLIPGVEETISSRVPAFRYKGRAIISFGAAKGHLSLFVMRGGVMKAMRKELKGYDTSTFVIRFQPEKPLPMALVKKIVKARIAERDAKPAS